MVAGKEGEVGVPGEHPPILGGWSDKILTQQQWERRLRDYLYTANKKADAKKEAVEDLRKDKLELEKK